MKKGVDITMLKVLMISGKLKPEDVTAIIERAEADPRVNLLKSPIGWYLEEISAEEDVFLLVKKVCDQSGIKFLTISGKTFFAICKAIKEQTAVIAQIIEDIQYPELTEIQREAGYGSKHFGTSGLVCNLAEAFQLSYIDAEKQPVIAITKLRMNAHTAMCRSNEEQLKKLFEKNA